MPKISITDKDIMAVKELEADWYVLEVTDIEDKWKMSTAGNNICEARFTVRGPKNAGVSFKHFFVEKSIGENYDTLVPFLNCFVPEGQKLAKGDYDTDHTKGKLFEAWCFYDDSGRFSGNRADKFRRHKAVAGRTA